LWARTLAPNYGFLSLISGGGSAVRDAYTALVVLNQSLLTTLMPFLGVGKFMTPRFIRLRDAPAYLGMDRNRFNAEVRPFLVEIPIGKQGVAFDRVDLDRFADEYKRRNGRPAAKGGLQQWGVSTYRGSGSETAFGTSTESASAKGRFTKALARARSKKRKNTLHAEPSKSAKNKSTESGRSALSAKPLQST
jgi:hypothetical protein